MDAVVHMFACISMLAITNFPHMHLPGGIKLLHKVLEHETVVSNSYASNDSLIKSYQSKIKSKSKSKISKLKQKLK